MNATQLLKSLLVITILSGALAANEDEAPSKCEKKYDKCIEKCDDKEDGSEECYNKCEQKNEKCIAAEEE